MRNQEIFHSFLVLKPFIIRYCLPGQAGLLFISYFLSFKIYDCVKRVVVKERFMGICFQVMRFPNRILNICISPDDSKSPGEFF